jgi:hypothetical protein
MAESWLLIVGIVDDARNDGLGDPVKPAVYIPSLLSGEDLPTSAQIHD